jgi:hypothetical protein
MIKSAQVIPESELWLHSPKVRDTLDRAMAWAEKHPPKESDLNALERKIRFSQKQREIRANGLR